MPILDDISQLYSEWKVDPEFSEFYKSKNKFYDKFNNHIVINYLEKVFCLIEENKLEIDKISLEFNCEVSNLSFKSISEDLIEKINILKSDLSINRFWKEQQEAIQYYFDRNFQINLEISQASINFSLFKLALIKIYEFILNLISINFFINNANNLIYFASKFTRPNQELDGISLDEISTEFSLKSNWYELLKSGINPFFLVSKSFKKNLSEKFFLYIVYTNFLDVKNSGLRKDISPNYSYKLANDFWLIRLCLENSKIGTINDLAYLYKNNINCNKIADQIVKLLKDNEAFKEYLSALVTLTEDTQALNEEFSILYNNAQKNIINSRRNQVNDSFSQHISKGNCLFKLPRATQSNSNRIVYTHTY